MESSSMMGFSNANLKSLVQTKEMDRKITCPSSYQFYFKLT
jgi:hypothetical protein